MNDYITNLPEALNKLFLPQKISLPNTTDLNVVGFKLKQEIAQIKFNQFSAELFLFFYNIEVKGMIYVDDLFECFFKRLMAYWMIILPEGLTSVDQVKRGFKSYIKKSLKALDELSVSLIYKDWLKRWDQWVDQNRSGFIQVYKAKFGAINPFGL